MISTNLIETLDKLSQDHPSLGTQIDQIKTNYRESLWHNITDQLYNLTLDSEFDQGNDLVTFFNTFPSNPIKINKLKYIRIAVNCSRQFQSKYWF